MRRKEINYILQCFYGVFAIASLTISTTEAATITPQYDQRGFIYMLLDGEISDSDSSYLEEALNVSKTKGLRVWGIILRSPGGSVDGGLRLASIIRENQLSTYVSANGYCESACFFPFAAGVNRIADTSARVGVHSASEEGIETYKAAAATIKFSRALAALDVPDQILGKIVKTPPNAIYYLTSEDLSSMGVQFVATPASSIKNVVAEQRRVKSSIVENPAWDRTRARELNKRGIDEIHNGRSDIASVTLANAATLSPFDAEILGNLGYAQYLTGQYDAALGSLLTALKLSPNRAMTLQNIGLVYVEMNNIQSAAQYFIAYVSNAKTSPGAIGTIQKWSSDSSSPKRAEAASLALSLLANQ
ncbi:hypothetical protein ACE1BS_25265 [Aeromonas jandaei]